MRFEQSSIKPRQAGGAARLDAKPYARIHIERLVLHGFAPADRHRIAQGVQTELARLMGESATLASLRAPLAIERVDGGSIRLRVDASPRATGSLIAQSIYRSLRGGAAAPAASLGVPTEASVGERKR